MANPAIPEIRFKFSFGSLHADDDGEVVLRVKLPATEAAKAALFPIYREIVFEAVCKPVDVVNSEETV